MLKCGCVKGLCCASKLFPFQLPPGSLDQLMVLWAKHGASATPKGRVLRIAVILDSRLINEDSQRIGRELKGVGRHSVSLVAYGSCNDRFWVRAGIICGGDIPKHQRCGQRLGGLHMSVFAAV